MKNFKYVVANKDGKKLSGDIEAPNEERARQELNGLGFSVLQLKESEKKYQESQLPKFIFEAIDSASKKISGSINAKDEKNAIERLNKEYNLTVTAIWESGSDEKEIEEARKKSADIIQNQNPEATPKTPIQKEENQVSAEEQKKTQIIQTQIELVLDEVGKLLKSFENEISADQKNLIYQKIDKLLRIKNSTNYQHTFEVAKELLTEIQNQEKTLMEKGFADKRLQLQLTTERLLTDLKNSIKNKNFSEELLDKINDWEAKSDNEKFNKNSSNFFQNFVKKIQRKFQTNPKLIPLKEQIKVYNRQIFNLIKIYFKESTQEYKTKIKGSIKAVWAARKKALKNLKEIKKQLKINENQKNQGTIVSDLTELTGWLLALYLIIYFVGLYLTNKNFGIEHYPAIFNIYETKIFKYLIIITFLLHCSLSIKINFYKKNNLATIAITFLFVVFSSLTIFNF